MKVCCNCQEAKEYPSYWKSSTKYDGLQSTCKECHRKRDKDYIYKYARKSKLKTQYGLTQADFDILMLKQNGQCAICEEESDRILQIDHNHKTGEVRGLLCWKCNRGIGFLMDSPKNLRKAANYLENKAWLT